MQGFPQENYLHMIQMNGSLFVAMVVYRGAYLSRTEGTIFQTVSVQGEVIENLQ